MFDRAPRFVDERVGPLAHERACRGDFEAKRDAYIWMSEDTRRIPVLIRAEFAIGSASATLTAYKAGTEVAAR